MKEDTRPLMVTIRCCTYNHEPYIRQCLEGFVMQKTDFRFEAIVHDDASTDGTAAIVKEYAEKYPDIIKPIFETENQYSKHNGSLRRIMEEHTHGKYAALCEGDDYWIDPLKLQKQVDFLEANPCYSMSHTGFAYYYQNADYIKPAFKNMKHNISIAKKTNHLIPFILDYNKYRIQTCSVVVRKDAWDKAISLRAEIENVFLMGDTQLWCFLNKIGHIHFLPEVTCIYRRAEGSVSYANTIEKQRLFSVSASEMRVYMAKRLGLPAIYQEYFRKHLVKDLITYLPYNDQYKCHVDVAMTLKEQIKYKINLTSLGKCIRRKKDALRRFHPIIACKRKVKKIPNSIFRRTNNVFLNVPNRRIRTWYLRLFIAEMGTNVYIGKGLKINVPSKIYIGNNVYINDCVRLDGRSTLCIGNNVDIATESAIWTEHHDYNDDYHRIIGGMVIIEDYCWICFRSVILPCIRIGKGSVVGACAVVTKDVEHGVVVGGIPAKKIAVRKSKLLYELNKSRW